MISQDLIFQSPHVPTKLPLNYGGISAQADANPGVADTATVVTAGGVGFNAVMIFSSVAGVFSVTFGLDGANATVPTATNTDSTTSFKVPLIALTPVLFMVSTGTNYVTDMQFKTTTVTGTLYTTFLKL